MKKIKLAFSIGVMSLAPIAIATPFVVDALESKNYSPETRSNITFGTFYNMKTRSYIAESTTKWEHRYWQESAGGSAFGSSGLYADQMKHWSEAIQNMDVYNHGFANRIFNTKVLGWQNHEGIVYFQYDIQYSKIGKPNDTYVLKVFTGEPFREASNVFLDAEYIHNQEQLGQIRMEDVMAKPWNYIRTNRIPTEAEWKEKFGYEVRKIAAGTVEIEITLKSYYPGEQFNYNNAIHKNKSYYVTMNNLLEPDNPIPPVVDPIPPVVDPIPPVVDPIPPIINEAGTWGLAEQAILGTSLGLGIPFMVVTIAGVVLFSIHISRAKEREIQKIELIKKHLRNPSFTRIGKKLPSFKINKKQIN